MNRTFVDDVEDCSDEIDEQDMEFLDNRRNEVFTSEFQKMWGVGI
jgi:hypothetical protein